MVEWVKSYCSISAYYRTEKIYDNGAKGVFDLNVVSLSLSLPFPLPQREEKKKNLE